MIAPRTLFVGLIALQAIACLTPDDRFVGLPGRTAFVVRSASLEDGALNVPLNQPVRIEFSQYLDRRSFEYFNAVDVTSGGIRGRGIARYRMADRSLTFFPTINLRPSLVYTLNVDRENLRSLGGDELAIRFQISFQTASAGTVEQAGLELDALSFARDVAPIFEASCNGCHAGEPLMPLDYDSLFELTPQTDPARRRVRAFAPERSYLMHKILPDYPDRRSTVMPPPWSDAEPLDAEQIDTIEVWILTGAEP